MSEKSTKISDDSKLRLLRPGLVPFLAALLIGGRWLQQGTSNLYTKIGFHPYVPDPDLGLRKSSEEFFWLGLDLLGISLAIGLGAVAVCWLLLRKGKSKLAVAAEIIAGGILLVPVLAFLSGNPPEGAVETQGSQDRVALASGIRGSLPGLPEGSYAAIEHPDAAIAAQLVAGGEHFEARFQSGLVGELRFDPSDLTKPIAASFQVDASSVKTGIDLRNEHAQKDLQVAEHPHLSFEFGELSSAQLGEGDKLAFEAKGKVVLAGRTHEVKVVGSITPVSERLGKRLAIAPGTPHLLVQAELHLFLPDTVIGNDGTFDTDDVPVVITLVLKHSEK